MTTIILNIDGHHERPQQYRRQNNSYSTQQKMQSQQPATVPAPQAKPEEKEEKCGWAELWGRENSLCNAKDIFFGGC